MRERIKEAILTAIGALLIGGWLGYEFGLFKPPKLPTEVRELLSIPLKAGGALIIAAVLFLPVLAIAQWLLEKFGISSSAPKWGQEWPAFAIGAAVSILAGCWIVFGENEPEGNIEAKRKKLETLRRQQYAEIERRQGECKAIAIEFEGDWKMVGACMDSYRFTVEMASSTISDIDKRLDELHSAECATIRAKVKKNGGGLVPLGCENSLGFRYLTDEEAPGKSP